MNKEEEVVMTDWEEQVESAKTILDVLKRSKEIDYLVDDLSDPFNFFKVFENVELYLKKEYKI